MENEKNGKNEMEILKKYEKYNQKKNQQLKTCENSNLRSKVFLRKTYVLPPETK